MSDEPIYCGACRSAAITEYHDRFECDECGRESTIDPPWDSPLPREARRSMARQMITWPELTDAQVRRIGYLLNPPPRRIR